MMSAFFDARPYLAIPGVILGAVSAVGGVASAAMGFLQPGRVLSAMSMEGASGIALAVGGILVTMHGLWSGMRAKAAQDALNRETEAVRRYDELVNQMVPIKDELKVLKHENARLRRRVEFCEANHETAYPRPG